MWRKNKVVKTTILFPFLLVLHQQVIDLQNLNVTIAICNNNV